MSFVQKAKPEDVVYLLILLFLPTQFGKHFWPSFSYVSGIRVDYLSPTLYFTDVLIFVLFILVFIKSFQNGLFKTIKKNRTLSIHLSLILAFLILSSLVSGNISRSLYGLIKLCEIIFLGFFTYYKLNKIRQEFVLAVIAAGIVFESALSIFQYVFQSSLGGLFYFLGERAFSGQTPGIANVSIAGDLILRPYGTLPHPNVLAGYLLFFMTILLFNIKFKRAVDYYFLASIILGTFSLFFTFSRFAIVLWIFTFIIYIFLKTKLSLARISLVFSSIILSISIIFYIYSPFYLRFAQSSFSEESFMVRKEILIDGISLFLKNPVLGNGLNNYLSGFISINNIFLLQPVHNIFILILIQVGIIGLVYSIWFLYLIFKNIIRKSIYIKLIFFYVILIGLLDHYFLTLQQGQLMLGFLMGFILNKNGKN